MKAIKRIALMAACAVLSNGTQAEWLEIYKFEDGMRVFVDQTTASRNGDIAEMSHLVRWPEPQLADDDHVFRSTVVRASYDCAGRHERYLSSASYAEAMGEGAKVLEDENEALVWYSISDSSMEDKLWTVACTHDGSGF